LILGYHLKDPPLKESYTQAHAQAQAELLLIYIGFSKRFAKCEHPEVVFIQTARSVAV